MKHSSGAGHAPFDRRAMACTVCGTVDKPASHTPGSILIEIVLWLALIVPGVVYSLWRHSARKPVCRACGSPAIVPVNTPAGRKVLEDRVGK